MKVKGKSIIIENFEDAWNVALAADDYDECEIGTNPDLYAALLAEVAPSRWSSGDYRACFANKLIEKYFNRIAAEQNNFDLLFVDFSTGVEKSPDRWIKYPHTYRKDWSDSRPVDYLRVLRHVISVGFSNFKFVFKEDHELVSQVCVIENKNDKKFTIERVVDPRLFDGLVQWVKEQEIKLNKKSTTQQADEFIANM